MAAKKKIARNTKVKTKTAKAGAPRTARATTAKKPLRRKTAKKAKAS